MTARLYIVRHGNTFDPGDVVTRVGGRTDMALSSSGRAQALALARSFRASGIAFRSARSGPLARTRETALAILSLQSAAPELVTDLFLREIDYGPDENRPETDVLARIGAEALDRWEREGAPPPGWRVDPDALVANWQGLFVKLADAPGAHLIVTSNGVARFARTAAGDAGAGKLRTGAWGVIALDGDAARVESWDERPLAD